MAPGGVEASVFHNTTFLESADVGFSHWNIYNVENCWLDPLSHGVLTLYFVSVTPYFHFSHAAHAWNENAEAACDQTRFGQNTGRHKHFSVSWKKSGRRRTYQALKRQAFFSKKTWAPLINLIVNWQHQTDHRHLNVHGWSLSNAPTVAVVSLTGDTMMLSRGNIIMVSGKVSHNPPQ